MVWGEGKRCCEKMARFPDLLVPTGSLPRGPDSVRSQVTSRLLHTHTSRGELHVEPKWCVNPVLFLFLPQGISCDLVPAVLPASPPWERVTFHSCVCTLPVSVYSFVCAFCVHTYLHTHSRHAGSLSTPDPWDPLLSQTLTSLFLPVPVHRPDLSLNTVGLPVVCFCWDLCFFFLVAFIEKDHYLMTVDVFPRYMARSRTKSTFFFTESPGSAIPDLHQVFLN